MRAALAELDQGDRFSIRSSVINRWNRAMSQLSSMFIRTPFGQKIRTVEKTVSCPFLA
jgi:hypothetical protein